MDFTGQLRERLTAAEGERDRLRGRVEMAIELLQDALGDLQDEGQRRIRWRIEEFLLDQVAAAIPHTEWEASETAPVAPIPKDKLGST